MVILSSILMFIAISIDYLIIQILLFSRIKHSERKYIWLGHYLATSIILIVSFLISRGIVAIIPGYWVGLLGLVPLFLGIKILFSDENDNENNSHTLSNLTSNRFNSLFITYTLIVLSSSADDVSVFVSFFVGWNISEVIISIAVMLIMVSILCLTSTKLANLSAISEKISRHEKFLVSIVFIILGIYILIANGTIQAFFRLFM